MSKARRVPSSSPQFSSFPELYQHRDLAYRLVGLKEWQALIRDAESQRKAHAERLVRLDEEKHRSTCMKIRGFIAGMDWLLSLPQTIEVWRKEK